MTGIPYQPEEDAIIRELFPRNATHKVAALIGRSASSVAQRAARLGVQKNPDYLDNAAFRFNGTHVNGISNRFKRGSEPPNKGRPQSEWMPAKSRKRCQSTQFKPVQMRGAAQHNYRPIGTLRVNNDGYLERKVNDDHPVPARRWVGVHRLVWEAENGPVPAGHVVVFKPGRRTACEAQITLDAVELITRVELMQRNTRHRFPKELADLIAMKGALTRRINNRAKEAQTP